MKGILGAIHFDGAPIDGGDVAAMRGALLGRGVARDDAWRDDHVALAGVTWSPVATGSAESTVYVDAESRCVVVADALLFDRDDLADSLGVTRASRSERSDAELILRSYLRWGDECAARLYGDFAFVVWDPRHRRVYCARDPFGVRPLYFHHAPGSLFAFASNATAVATSRRVPWTLNEGRIADFLVSQLEGIDHTSTFFSTVHRLAPAHFCRVDARGLTEHRYYVPGAARTATLPASDDEWADAVREALERAVRQHVVGTDRIGSMLSGGLDSSSVAAIAANVLAAEGRGPLPTFSAIDGAQPDCAETRAIRAMSARTGLAPRFVDRSTLTSQLPELGTTVWDTEEPFDGSMLLVDTQYRIAAREGVGAVLDGIDADNLFSDHGYMARLLRAGRFATALAEARGQERFYGPSDPAWHTLLESVPAAFVPQAFRRRYRVVRRAYRVRANLESSLLAPDFARRVRLGDRLARLERHGESPADADVHTESARAIAHPYVSCGVERYLRVASHHGIEPRHPFLDRRLVELCLRVPDGQRLRDGFPKAVLRRAMARTLPPEVCWRRGKEHLGWDFSLTWLERSESEVLARLHEERPLLSPYVDVRGLDRRIEAYRRSRDPVAAGLVLEAAHLGAWLSRYGRRPTGSAPAVASACDSPPHFG